MTKPLKRGFKMDISLKCPRFLGQNLLIIAIIAGILFSVSPYWTFRASQAEANLAQVSVAESLGEIAMIEENSFLPLSEHLNPQPQPVREIQVIVTGYSSTIDQTDLDPFITAAGTWVRDGIVANNYLLMGTKIRMPELYGDKVFVVEDRMSWTKGNYQIDIWFPSYWEALNFGAKRTYIEVLEG